MGGGGWGGGALGRMTAGVRKQDPMTANVLKLDPKTSEIKKERYLP